MQQNLKAPADVRRRYDGPATSGQMQTNTVNQAPDVCHLIDGLNGRVSEIVDSAMRVKSRLLGIADRVLSPQPDEAGSDAKQPGPPIGGIAVLEYQLMQLQDKLAEISGVIHRLEML
jgi:hypothetical protein